ncbi:hypothetical protein O4J55_19770, partial [Paracoccus sp. PXZ]
DHLPGQAGFAGMCPAARQPQGGGALCRSRNGLTGEIGQKPLGPRLEHPFGASMFGQIRGIGQRVRIPAHGESVDFEAFTLKRRDLTPDEAV